MIDRDHAEHYLWGAACDGWHLVKQEALSVIQERMPPGAAEARHYHKRARQFFFILSGTATFELGTAREALRPHEGVEVPPGMPHRILNESAHDLEFIVVSQPKSHGDRVVVEAASPP